MCGEAVEDIDETKDGRGYARHENDIKLEYPGSADEGGDEGEDETEDEENDCRDSGRFRADGEGGCLLEGSRKYEEAGEGQLESRIWKQRQEHTQSLSRVQKE